MIFTMRIQFRSTPGDNFNIKDITLILLDMKSRPTTNDLKSEKYQQEAGLASEL